MSVARTGLFAGFLSLTVLRLASAGLSFALVVCLARVLGPAALGTYSFAMATFVLLQYLPTMGLHVAITRNVAAEPGEAGRQMMSGLMLSLPMTALALFGTAAYAVVFAPDDAALRHGLVMVSVALVPTAFTTLVEATLLGQERSASVARVGLIETSGRTAASLFAIALGGGIDSLLALFVVGRVVSALAYAGSTEVRDLLRTNSRNLAACRALARRIPVFFAIMLLAQVMDRLDFLLLGALAGVGQVGQYAAPYKLYELMLMLPRIASLLLLPRLAICFGDRSDLLQPLVLSILRFAIAMGLPAVMLIAYFAPEIMRLFGPRYESGAEIFLVLCFAALGVTLNNLFSMVLIVTGSQRLDLFVLAISVLVYAALLAVLVPRHGALGAAWATLFVSVLQPVVAALALRHRLSLRAGAASLLRVIPAALLMAATLWIAAPRLALSPYVAAPIALLLCAGLFVALRVASRGDLRRLVLAFGQPMARDA